VKKEEFTSLKKLVKSQWWNKNNSFLSDNRKLCLIK
jgi:hypothetical protein